METYAQTIDYLYRQMPAYSVIGAGAYKPGLDNARMLDTAFGNAHKEYKTIHVAGTNGKGSTSNIIASILAEAGYKVGLYTSPHIFDFRERIRVNGKKIEEAAVVEFVERYRKMHLECSPSFFELTTIMAFDYFRREKVDVAVIETGLGGRLDTTNIITPVLSIITNISLDHTALLGNTPAQIAREKGGIIKPGVPVVVGEANQDVRAVLAEIAAAQGSEICFAQDTPIKYRDVPGDRYYTLLSNPAIHVTSDLKGEFQLQNINTALHAMNILKWVGDISIINGLGYVSENTGLTGRWTIVREADPRVIFDTGHNIGAWEYLAPALTEIAQTSSLSMVLGFVDDKDVASIMPLLPKNADYHFVTPAVKRGRDAKQLKEMASAHGLQSTAHNTVMDGCRAALNTSCKGSTIFIGGSNYVAAEVDLSVFSTKK